MNEETEEPKTGDISYSTRVALIERELQKAMQDIEELRTHDRRKLAAKACCQMLDAALRRARNYVREFEESL
jgi:hypothetical protein